MKKIDAPRKTLRVTAPAASALTGRFNDAFYGDCFARHLTGTPYPTALAAYQAMSANAPRWVNGLLLFRDRVVAPFGMTPTHGFSARQSQAEPLECGDALDFFTIAALDANELQLHIRDHDFTVSISVYLHHEDKRQSLYVTSLVDTHTRLGSVYVSVIAPFHRLVVKSMMNRLDDT